MCLIVLAHQLHCDYPLILAANRDEFRHRPTHNMHWWPDVEILAGKDLEAGGTWLAMHKNGRWAAVTNFRKVTTHNACDHIDVLKTRGQLVVNFLCQNDTALQFAKNLKMDQFAGFNLLLWDNQELIFCANQEQQQPKVLPAGLYGLSNGQLDSDWPKVNHVKLSLRESLKQTPAHKQLQTMMQHTSVAHDELLPKTGITLDWERLLSSCFIDAPHYNYGTRTCITILRDTLGKVDVLETCFDHPKPLLQHFTWRVKTP